MVEAGAALVPAGAGGGGPEDGLADAVSVVAGERLRAFFLTGTGWGGVAEACVAGGVEACVPDGTGSDGATASAVWGRVSLLASFTVSDLALSEFILAKTSARMSDFMF